ncbi:MAG: carboxypeptidase-like regulatory domain-containing protein [bacterium]|nr:carboxypeptidase-like regulatory domain-containing protein [bacterium]
MHGRVAWRGELVEGVVIQAFKDGSGDYMSDPAAVSDPTTTDGTYRLELPPGQYTLVARSPGVEGRRPGPGDYFCYYSGSPVTVNAGAWTPVGFNLVKVKLEDRQKGDSSRIDGVVTYQDQPLERLYLYLYEKADDAFRGPGLATIPVGSGGRFRASVRPGSYFLIARKRLKGGMYGPMEIGDYFNYYPGNPVVVGESETVNLNLETVTRISQLEEGEPPPPSVRGQIVDPAGLPVSGVRVLAYLPDETKGRPLYFSAPSGPDGRFTLMIPRPGEYTLVARERFGGPALPDEFSGGQGGGTVKVRPGEETVTSIVVRKEKAQ